MWKGPVQLVAEIKACDKAGLTMAGLALSYICIDSMAFLSMPAGKKYGARDDFIAWANTYLKGHQDQPYQYSGLDVYAARCALLHTFTAEAKLHADDPTIVKFVYHNGGKHNFDPATNPTLAIIGTASFTNDVAHAVSRFLDDCSNDKALRERVETRLPDFFASSPISTT